MESFPESKRLWDFVPIGFSFRPSEYDLIRHYLYNRIANKPLSDNGMIRDCNLYGSLEPWEIWNTFGGPLLELQHHHDEDLYFFTHLKKANSKGSRIRRRVGSGTWQGEDAAKPIVVQHSDQKIIGWRKRFRYEKKDYSGDDHQHGCWIMHEYSLDSAFLRPDQPNDYVLCRLRKNHLGFKKINNKKRKLSEEPEMPASTSNSQAKRKSSHVGFKKVNNKKSKLLEEPEILASTSNSQAIRKANNDKMKLEESDTKMPSTSDSEAIISNSNSKTVDDAELFFHDDDDWVLQLLWPELQPPSPSASSVDTLFNNIC